MAVLTKNKNYKWEFDNIGGSTRVKIETGEDVAHLYELDLKMWTVLSCPIRGLEIDDKSLSYIDFDKDSKIRVNDIISTSKWIVNTIKDVDSILKGEDFIDIAQFNEETEDGKKLLYAAKQILINLNKEGNVISIADTKDIAAIFAKTRFNGDGVITESTTENADEKEVIASIVATIGGVADRSGEQGVNAEKIELFYKLLDNYVSWYNSSVEVPYGVDTDKIIDAYNILDAKIKDFFMRSKLASFSPDSTAILDVQTSRIESISAENLTEKLEEISSYPIARVNGVGEINLEEPINPVWASYFEILKSTVLKGKKKLTESDWNTIKDSFSAYIQWKNSKAGAEVESLGIDTIKQIIVNNNKESLLSLITEDLALKEEAENIEMVDKFLHIYRDFYRLLRNFITLHDFYAKDKTVSAIFQSGRLIIDQRECRFCMKVADMAKHNTMAASSGMFLIYCDCVAKNKPEKLSIVAAVTVGNVGDLVVGKNAIYYDNEGGEWDAVITKVIENPISVLQAFWLPYKKMATTVENLINKSAAEKDAKVMSDATEKLNTAQTSLSETTADGANTPTPPFDIAKFAGIFAAIGMALGMIGTAFVAVYEELVELTWWKLILVFVGLLLAISGPAMILAWLKLRRRNIAPLLNANGWAVNASSKISIPFGETLTDSAKFPKLKLKDPYKKSGMSSWKKWMISIVIVAVIFIGLWMFNLLSVINLKSPLPRYNQVESVTEEISEQVVLDETVYVVENDSLTNE